jgi:hypothetical protein
MRPETWIARPNCQLWFTVYGSRGLKVARDVTLEKPISYLLSVVANFLPPIRRQPRSAPQPPLFPGPDVGAR